MPSDSYVLARLQGGLEATTEEILALLPREDPADVRAAINRLYLRGFVICINGQWRAVLRS